MGEWISGWWKLKFSCVIVLHIVLIPTSLFVLDITIVFRPVTIWHKMIPPHPAHVSVPFHLYILVYYCPSICGMSTSRSETNTALQLQVAEVIWHQSEGVQPGTSLGGAICTSWRTGNSCNFGKPLQHVTPRDPQPNTNSELTNPQIQGTHKRHYVNP